LMCRSLSSICIPSSIESTLSHHRPLLRITVLAPGVGQAGVADAGQTAADPEVSA
jgi:hypothetical protein